MNVTNIINGQANGFCEATDELINRLEIPAAIIRVGYLSNEAELNLLLTDGYAKKIAQAIAITISNQYGEIIE